MYVYGSEARVIFPDEMVCKVAQLFREVHESEGRWVASVRFCYSTGVVLYFKLLLGIDDFAALAILHCLIGAGGLSPID
jgi:hypothetical protein